MKRDCHRGVQVKRLRWFRNSWRVRPAEDTRPYFEASIVFQAADMDEADRLMDAMVDALGCTDETCGNGRECPHFRVGGLHQMDDE